MEVLCEHYERLGTASVDDQFDGSWKEHVQQKVTEYREMSRLRKVKVLDRGIILQKFNKNPKELEVSSRDIPIANTNTWPESVYARPPLYSSCDHIKKVECTIVK